MTFDEWMKIGIANKWCGVPVCVTHDGTPISNAEAAEWEQGADPCHHVVRLYESEEVADAVNRDFVPYKSRSPLVS